VNDLEETSIKGIQYIDQASYRLEITGLVRSPKSYTYEEVLDFNKYSKVVTLNCVVGWSAKILWEGVLLKDLLHEAGVRPEAKIAIFYASDGFSTSLPLDYIIDNDIILADKMNGLVIPPAKGFPFQLVAEQKFGYKWIKWLTKIELSDDVNYRGTYEANGYNNDADISGPKREF
jgi:DMSO/TMAO reductase YedYZ molybdopterin-dependent catalytic subunit